MLKYLFFLLLLALTTAAQPTPAAFDSLAKRYIAQSISIDANQITQIRGLWDTLSRRNPSIRPYLDSLWVDTLQRAGVTSLRGEDFLPEGIERLTSLRSLQFLGRGNLRVERDMDCGRSDATCCGWERPDLYPVCCPEAFKEPLPSGIWQLSGLQHLKLIHTHLPDSLALLQNLESLIFVAPKITPENLPDQAHWAALTKLKKVAFSSDLTKLKNIAFSSNSTLSEDMCMDQVFRMLPHSVEEIALSPPQSKGISIAKIPLWISALSGREALKQLRMDFILCKYDYCLTVTTDSFLFKFRLADSLMFPSLQHFVFHPRESSLLQLNARSFPKLKFLSILGELEVKHARRLRLDTLYMWVHTLPFSSTRNTFFKTCGAIETLIFAVGELSGIETWEANARYPRVRGKVIFWVSREADGKEADVLLPAFQKMFPRAEIHIEKSLFHPIIKPFRY